MLTTHLFNDKPTRAQRVVIGFWLLNLLLVGVLWVTTTEFSGGLSTVFDAIGMLFGLLATYFALTQFMLMGRIAWIERLFGLDHLASYHRLNGYLAIGFILIHPLFITISYAMDAHRSFLHESVDIVTQNNFVWLALIAEILFIAVVGSSIYIARKRLKFESWYFVHLAVYVAIVIVPFHQLTVGDSFVGDQHPLARIYWLSLYAFVGLNLIIWRFGVVAINFLRFDFRVDEVVRQTPTTTSIYISGKKPERFRRKAGQFIFVRVLAKGFWWQEHPFSISSAANSSRLRLTIRHVGDYTNAIAQLKPGKRVLINGPFGIFTNEVAYTKKRLFIAGGIGITPFRPLAEEAVETKLNTVLLYANKTPADTPLKSELATLARRGLRTSFIYSDAGKGYRGERGYIDLARIRQLVPDFKTRDIYLCGPPPMMEGLIQTLTQVGIRKERLHYERFSLHIT